MKIPIHSIIASLAIGLCIFRAAHAFDPQDLSKKQEKPSKTTVPTRGIPAGEQTMQSPSPGKGKKSQVPPRGVHKPKKSELLDFIIVLDKGMGNESIRAHFQELGPITEDVARGITARKILIISTGMLNNLYLIFAVDPLHDGRSVWLLKHARDEETGMPFKDADAAQKELKKIIDRDKNNDWRKARKNLATRAITLLQDEYETYLSPNGNFMVLVPINPGAGKTEPLEKTGLNPDTLTYIGPKDRQAVFARYEGVEVALSVDELTTLFAPNDKLPKHFILSGHGSATPIFAGLTKPEYQKLLTFLNTIGCASLAVSSCYTGGDEVALMHDILQGGLPTTFDLHDILYVILMGATTANPLATDIQFHEYFDAIDTFTKNQSPDALARAVEALGGWSPDRDTPSVYFPTKYKDLPALFRAVESDKRVVRLTCTKQKQLLLEKVPELKLKTDDVLLYYPAIITIPVVINGSAKLISMAQGEFIHAFTKITAKELTLAECIRLIIGPISPSRRIYLVKELIYGNNVIHGLIIDSTPDKITVTWRRGEDYFTVAHRDFKAKVGRTLSGEKFSIEKEIKIIDQEAYLSYLSIIDQVSLSPEILRQASGGQETADMAREAALKTILETAGITGERVVLLTDEKQKSLLKKDPHARLILRDGDIFVNSTWDVQIPLLLEGLGQFITDKNKTYHKFGSISAKKLTRAQCISRIINPFTSPATYTIAKLECKDLLPAQEVYIAIKDARISGRVGNKYFERPHTIKPSESFSERFIEDMIKEAK